MPILYEDLEQYLESITENNINKVWLSKLRMRQDIALIGAVRVLYIDDKGMEHMFEHAEGINPVTYPRGVEQMPKETADVLMKKFAEEGEAFDVAIEKEYNDMNALLTELGVTIIKGGLI